MRNRSTKLELMDLGPAHYTQEEYRDCLYKLGIIGTLLGGDRSTLCAFDALPNPPASILDVGCGGGSFTLKLAKKYPSAHVVGIDIDQQALTVANEYKVIYEKKHNVVLSNLSFQHRQQPELNEPAHSFDVVTATLVWHHLTDEQIIQFLRSAKSIARKAIIINDLHRHPLAYAAFWIISPLFNNRMTRYDGLLSILRSFKRQELEKLLHAAGLAPNSWKVTWSFPFRWIITIDCS